MRIKSATWFECKVRYDKTQEDGTQKKVTEQYVVDALSFAEAEQRIAEELSAYIGGEYEIADVKKAAYREAFFSDKTEDDKYFKARLQFITLNEKTMKEKLTAQTFLVQAPYLDAAVRNINEAMIGTMIDYRKSNITETKILNVFEYHN